MGRMRVEQTFQLQIACKLVVSRAACEYRPIRPPHVDRWQERTRQAHVDPITIGSCEAPYINLCSNVMRPGLHVSVDQRLSRRRWIGSQQGEGVGAGPV